MKYLLMLSLLLTGCNTFNTKPVNNTALITWERFDDTSKVDAKCRELADINPISARIKGCADFNLIARLCTIYSYNPRSLDDEHVCTLGHEVLHCFNGNYHK